MQNNKPPFLSNCFHYYIFKVYSVFTTPFENSVITFWTRFVDKKFWLLYLQMSQLLSPWCSFGWPTKKKEPLTAYYVKIQRRKIAKQNNDNLLHNWIRHFFVQLNLELANPSIETVHCVVYVHIMKVWHVCYDGKSVKCWTTRNTFKIYKK